MMQFLIGFVATLAALIVDRTLGAAVQIWGAKRMARRFLQRYRSHDTLPDFDAARAREWERLDGQRKAN